MKIMYEGKTQSLGEGCDVSHPRSEHVYAEEGGFFRTTSMWVDSLDALPGEVDLENSS
jgi:hypothetical protein